MEELAAGVWRLRGHPRNLFNVYLLEDVLVDAASRWDGRRILRDLRGRSVRAHALTHAHPDHQGSSKRVCETLGIPLWCGEADADAAEDPRLILERAPRHPLNPVNFKLLSGPGHPVERPLREGDEVAGFQVIHAPGHSRGHVAFWRESDRVLVLGDVLTNMSTLTGLHGLREPPGVYTADPATNRASARRLGALRPDLVCFGHGPPCRDAGRFSDFAAALPA